MNYVVGALLAGLAIAALSPATMYQLRDRVEALEDQVSSSLSDSPYVNRAVERSIDAERRELTNRVQAFNVWKGHKVCAEETDEYREFLRETGRAAPVVGCN